MTERSAQPITTITAKVIIEPGIESPERTKQYVVQSLKAACRNIRDGSVIVAIYDEKDDLIGMDVSGSPSTELQDLVEGLYED